MLDKYINDNLNQLFFCHRKKNCPNTCENQIWEKKKVFPSTCDHEKNRLKMGFKNLTDALKLLASKGTAKRFPETLHNIVTDLSQVDSLKENVDQFEEEFRAVFQKI